jgi:type II secretory pathway component GspD/PulD (secretin)
MRYRARQHDPKQEDVRLLPQGVVCLTLAVVQAGAQAPQGPLPTLPLTQLDERALAADLDNRAFTLTFAQPVPIRDLLLLLVRGTTLSVVPDPAIGGTFIGELKNVTVRQALGLILPPLGLDYGLDGGFIRVFPREPETRLFDLNYLATIRTGTTLVGGASAGGSSASVAGTTGADVFAEIANGLKTILSERAAFNVDRKAGLLQVSDFPERLDRVSLYLDTVQDRVHRQVQIDVRVVEVELGDSAAQSLDWAALARGGADGAASQRPNMVGLRVADVGQFLAALQAQGRVSLVASPRVLALNNEPALVRAVSQAPDAVAGERPQVGSVTLEVTPQITSDGLVTLSVSPIVTIQDADARDQPPSITAIRETDTLARIASGETLVVAGFARDRETRERRNTGIRGGWFGRSTVVTKTRVELVILLTPRIVGPFGAAE